MSDDGLYGAYARNAYINALDQHNENLYSWKVYARELETRIKELEAQKEKYLYFLGGALGTAAEEGMRKRALYVYLKTINQSIRARMDSDAAQKLIDFISPNNPDVSNLLDKCLIEDKAFVANNRIQQGRYLSNSVDVLEKVQAIREGYEDVLSLYEKEDQRKTVAPKKPVIPGIGFELDEKSAPVYVKMMTQLAAQ